MPSKTIPVLSVSLAALVTAYLGLVIVTVSMASWQTNLAVEVQETEAEIASLETRYYDMVARIDGTDPAALGLGKPARVTYAAEVAAPTFTLR